MRLYRDSQLKYRLPLHEKPLRIPLDLPPGTAVSQKDGEIFVRYEGGGYYRLLDVDGDCAYLQLVMTA